MKKLYTIFAFVALGLLSVSLTGCKTDALDTDQYSAKQVRLVSYGPNPVMRGGAVTFIGSNLDKIVEVQVPGVDAISDIEVVKSGLQSEIRVILPVEGPEVGKLTLKASDGTTFTTSTELTYSEPIVFSSFEVASTPSYPGDEIKLKGDYMNLVKSVEFAGGEKVEVTGIDRHNATVIIPATAITGQIILSDEGEIANLIYSEKDLTIGDPTVSSVTAASWKPSKSATISGKYLNMIESLSLEGGVALSLEDFSVSEDAKSITFTIPDATKSGDVVAISYAGKQFTAGKASMVEPTELSVAPSEIKTGETLVISGKDLDVVTSVTFPNADAITDFSLADGKISVSVPLKAKSGDIVLSLANGESVSVAYTLIAPTVTEVAPLSLKAGETITVKGTGLQFVQSATLGGKNVEIEANEDGSQLTITTVNTSVSGKIVLTLYNGETLEPADEITLSYDSLIIVNEMPSAEHIGATVTLKGENFMLIENIYIGEAKVTGYTSRSDTEITFVMPWNKIGSYSVYFDLLSGDRETCPQSIEVLLEQTITTIWSGEFNAGNWGGNQDLAWGGYDWSKVKAGQTLRFTLTQDTTQDWWQLALRHGTSWGELPEQVFVEMTAGQTVVDVVLSQTNLDDLIANGGLVITGCNYTLTKIELIGEISQEKTVWEGSAYSGANYENNLELGSEDDWVNAGLKVGDTIKIYFTAESETDWQIQLFDGHWNGMNMLFPDSDNKNQFNATNSPAAFSDGFITFKATDEVYTALTTKANWGYAMICQGKGITFTKMAIM